MMTMYTAPRRHGPADDAGPHFEAKQASSSSGRRVTDGDGRLPGAKVGILWLYNYMERVASRESWRMMTECDKDSGKGSHSRPSQPRNACLDLAVLGETVAGSGNWGAWAWRVGGGGMSVRGRGPWLGG